MSSRLVSGSLAAVALLLAVVFFGEQQRTAHESRRTDWSDRQATKRTAEALRKQVQAEGQTLTLSQFAAWLERQSGVAVVLDEDALNEAGVSFDGDEINLPVGTVSGQSLLACALDQAELGYLVEGRQVLITTPERAQIASSSLSLEVLALPQPGLTVLASEEDWYEQLTMLVAPDTWDYVGGAGHLEAVPGGLVVLQSREPREAISTIFSRLGELENPPRTWASVPLVPGDIAAVEARIRAALAEPISIDVKLEPLTHLIAQLADHGGFPAVLHARWIPESGVPPDLPVNVLLNDVSLDSVLRSVLEPLELAFLIRNEMLVVTTREFAEAHLPLVAYPVHDLVATERGPDFDPLTVLLHSTIATDQWDEVGGPGSIGGVARGWLIVRQSDEVHAQIDALLANLRRALAEPGPLPLALQHESAADAKIRGALSQELEFAFDQMTLVEICAELSTSLGINLQVGDSRDEEFAAVPRTCRFPRAPVAVQLRRLCDALELDYLIHGDVLWLTLLDDDLRGLKTHVYDIRPLIDADLGLTSEDGLTELLTAHLEPNSWDELGGPGSLACFRGLLVVSQADRVHALVEDLLTQLERHCLPDDPLPVDAPRVLAIAADATEDRLEAALGQSLEIDLPEAPLEQTLATLSQQAGVPITLDCAREAFFTDLPTPALASRKMSLAGVLDHVLRPLDLYYCIRHQEIVILSAVRDGEAPLVTRLYRVRDLLSDERSLEALVTQSQESVAPDYWYEVGGPGVISAAGEEWMAVTADRARHTLVRYWLHQLRGESFDNETFALPTRKLEQTPTARVKEHDDPRGVVQLSGASRLQTHPRRESPPRRAPGPDPFFAPDDPFSPHPHGYSPP